MYFEAKNVVCNKTLICKKIVLPPLDIDSAKPACEDMDLEMW